MQQLGENRTQVRLGQKLYHHYREYVQFLNDFIITRPYTNMLILLPNIVMIMQLSVHFSHASSDSEQIQTFFNNISYLGISSAIMQIINISLILKYVILTTIMLLLLSPLFTIAQILTMTVLETNNHRKQIGHYRKLYQSSLMHKFTRVFISTFYYIAMPVFTSVGIKLISNDDTITDVNSVQQSSATNVTIGTFILILVPIVYILGQYHLLQIVEDIDNKAQTQSLILSRINFPNHILDSLLVYLYLILINKLALNYPFIAAIVIYLLRIGIAAYFKYYHPGVLKQHLFTLISSLIAILGLFIAYLCKQIYIVILSVVVLLVLINRLKHKITVGHNKQYDLVQNQQKTLQQLKRDLWNTGNFTYVFRQLIFLSRKTNSHRKQLLIEILKVKCYQLESKSRGGAKMTNTEDLLKFQNLFLNFLANMLIIGDNSISILRLLQNKDPKREIFAHQVKLLVNKITQNKQIVARMREINDISSQGLVLMKIMFNQFYNDLEFVKDMEQKSRMHITSLAQKQVKTRLFNKKTTAIFINILDEPGKITRVSKNLPAVLGHSPSDLLGKSINQIIPFTIQPHHDQILIKFVQKYSKKTMRTDPRIQFYAYNKDFQLQQCVIRYNFVMSYFSSFELSGVVRKIQEENKNVILMNEDGVLQGWTEELSTVFNFDEFQMGECLKFNVLALFPSLIKYNDAGGCSIKTVFFRSGKVKQKALQITQFRNLNGRQLQQKQMSTFKNLLQTDELIEAYLADIEYQLLSFCSGKAKLKKIVIKNFQRIQNFNEIQDNILKTLNGQKMDDNDDQQDLETKQLDKDVSMSEYSMAGDQSQRLKMIDSNFTLDFTKPHAFKKQEIRLQSEVSKSQLSIQLTDANHMEEDHLINDEINANAAEQQGNDSLIQASFSPKLQTQTNFIPFLIFIALCFIGIITWDQVVLSSTQTLMNKQCANVINRNRALMIYAKSSFNPNATYIREFDNGRLMEVSSFLGNENFDYKTYLGDMIAQNRFYMFNIQIPSTLDRILMAPNDTKKAEYQKEIEYNFNGVMQAWTDRFTESDQQWSNTIVSVRSNFTIRLIIISIGSIAFSLFLIYIYMQYRKQKKMTEAFFKFQKVDLDEKMAAIRKVIKNLQIKAMQWHLDKEFYDIIKKKDITNLQFQMQANPCETKIKFETSQQAQQKLAKKKLYTVVLFIVVFLLTQILFIILYSVLNFSQVDSFQTVPQDLNKACKLIVLPNLMLANMFYTVPQTMLDGYKSIQTQVLEKPLDSVPDLFNLLEDAPCVDCRFMYPLLTTNFRSFYSTFQQVINQKTLNNDQNITELFYAVDVVVQRVTQSLSLKSLIFLPATVFLYIFSLTVFFLSIYFNVRKMIQENQKLEVFLKYFDEEILVKNKHMNGLLNKNT